MTDQKATATARARGRMTCAYREFDDMLARAKTDADREAAFDTLGQFLGHIPRAVRNRHGLVTKPVTHPASPLTGVAGVTSLHV